MEELRHTKVVITGFMGTGKTTIGRLLAFRLGYDWVDTDALIEGRHGPIAEIFANHGEQAFRDLERLVCAELAGRERIVISTGGRLMLDLENDRLLSPDAAVFSLVATPEAIIARMKVDGIERPLLTGPDPEGRIRHLLAQRAAGYSKFTAIDTTGRSPDGVVDQIIERLRSGGSSTTPGSPESPRPEV